MKCREILTARAALLGSALLLAGCSDWSYSPQMRGSAPLEPMNLPAAQSAAPGAPTTFTQALAKDYAELASTMSKTPMTTAPGDYTDADYFSRKSLKADQGQVVLPENNANWLVPLEHPNRFRTQLAEGRARLMTALDGGGRERTPALAARAQVRYDCWVEQMERDWQTGANGTCKSEFLAALDEMEKGPKTATAPAAAPAPAPAPTLEFNVFFDFDKSNLTPEGRKIVDKAAEAASGNKAWRIVLVGKADLAGTDPYNMDLSHRRADAVRDALVADHVARDRIDASWVGERQPPVPTPDGVREPRNRVVTITFH
ncbi:MAG TPA: OmpA family protein [Stellaceae bacterium]|nr:OmpA family protein [Stellaceae bacterium]